MAGAVTAIDVTMDGGFVTLNSANMEMTVVKVETCEKATLEELHRLRYAPPCFGEEIFLCVSLPPAIEAFRPCVVVAQASEHMVAT